jgi:hypothetical protein
LASMAVDVLKIENGSFGEMAAEHTISLALFFAAIPFLWNHIDTYSEKELVKGPAASKDE